MFLFFNKNDQIYIDRIALLYYFIILENGLVGLRTPRIINITRKYPICYCALSCCFPSIIFKPHSRTR